MALEIVAPVCRLEDECSPRDAFIGRPPFVDIEGLPNVFHVLTLPCRPFVEIWVINCGDFISALSARYGPETVARECRYVLRILVADYCRLLQTWQRYLDAAVRQDDARSFVIRDTEEIKFARDVRALCLVCIGSISDIVSGTASGAMHHCSDNALIHIVAKILHDDLVRCYIGVDELIDSVGRPLGSIKYAPFPGAIAPRPDREYYARRERREEGKRI